MILTEIEKELVEIKWNEEAAEKGGYEHFMLKEIFEQPKAVHDTFNAYIRDGRIILIFLLSDWMMKQLKIWREYISWPVVLLITWVLQPNMLLSL